MRFLPRRDCDRMVSAITETSEMKEPLLTKKSCVMTSNRGCGLRVAIGFILGQGSGWVLSIRGDWGCEEAAELTGRTDRWTAGSSATNRKPRRQRCLERARGLARKRKGQRGHVV